jgi:hypothetical protein
MPGRAEGRAGGLTCSSAILWPNTVRLCDGRRAQPQNQAGASGVSILRQGLSV